MATVCKTTDWRSHVLYKQLCILSKLKKEMDFTVPEILNRNSFLYITAFLINCLEGYKAVQCTQVGPTAVKKTLDEVLEKIARHKLKHPNVVIPSIQKSHFMDARIENDKVVEFLSGLVVLAVQDITKTDKLDCNLSVNSDDMKLTINSCLKLIDHHQQKIHEAKHLIEKVKSSIKSELKEREKRAKLLAELRESGRSSVHMQNFSVEGLIKHDLEKREELCEILRRINNFINK